MIKILVRGANEYSKKQLDTLTDQLFLVDSLDNVTRKIDKCTAHRNEWIFSEEGAPHRAFSVFLFNGKGQLLLQQRSSEKITFPLYWTNSCCSHPLVHEDEAGIINESLQRGLFELGNELNVLSESARMIAKVLYRAKFDELWGEYELDYLVFARNSQEKEPTGFNRDEVESVKWIDREDVLRFVEETKLVTPWFKRIVKQTKFIQWWDEYVSHGIHVKAERSIVHLKGE